MRSTELAGQTEPKRMAQLAPRTFTPSLVDQAKKAQGIPSSYRLTRVLGVTDVTMTSWTAGRATPNDATALRLADMAGLDPSLVLAEIAVERAQDDESRAVWRGIAERLRHVGMAVMVGAFCTFATPPEARAFEAQHALESGVSVRYVNRRKRRRKGHPGRRIGDTPAQRKPRRDGAQVPRLH